MAKKPTNVDENNTGRVEPLDLVKEMQTSYVDYAMSVIVARALPDVRDGLKPVHRKILYAMWSMGLKANAKFRKSATVVGEVLGKYHPHGDLATYESMVRMAQDFVMRYPLVRGQGNFGSIDGDAPAAHRYTEAKLASIAEELLYDIDKDTVDFVPNYDGSLMQPSVLPAKLPNLLLNGSSGIAVGMATNIPPHNLGELCDAVTHLIDNPDAEIDELVKILPGPDFPTGGIMYDKTELKKAYATGRGSVVIRAKTDIEEMKNGMFRIIITEIPYQVNKAKLLEKIADLVRDKKIVGIKDLRDESDKDGLRVVVELKKESYPKKILNQLFKYTQLQERFHYNMVALLNGIQPKVLNLKEILSEYVKHRQNIIRRRTEYDLQKAKDRAHILEGLVLALENIDKIIDTIKKSKDKDEAKVNLVKQFKLSERQSIAILEMRLQQLANLERLKVEKELEEKRKLIKELEKILSSEKEIYKIIKTELIEIKEKHDNPRRTKIVASAVDKFSALDLIPNESTVVLITRDGYIKRLPPETFRTQSRGGKGVIGLSVKEEDMVEQIFATMTHNDLLFFTSSGRVFQLKAYEVPPASRTAKGQALVNFLQLAPLEKVTIVLSLEELEKYKALVMTTRNGLTKRVDLKAFENVRRSGLIAIKLKDDDKLEWVWPTTGKDDVMIVTQKGQSIRFSEKDARIMGRTATGVRGIKLKEGDSVVGMSVLTEGAKGEKMLIVTENGFGKMTLTSQYRVQSRGGSGIKTAKVTSKTGDIVGARLVDAGIEDMILISQKGQVIRMTVKSVSTLGRQTQGVRLMRLKDKNDRVAAMALIKKPEEITMDSEPTEMEIKDENKEKKKKKSSKK